MKYEPNSTKKMLPPTGAVALVFTIIILIINHLSSFASLGQATSSHSHLVDYDKTVSSSTFGEPVFRLQPPSVISYSNTRGTTLLCLASGSPKPTISWYTSPAGFDTSQQTALADDLTSDQSRLVTNVTNLRVILQNGSAVRLLPFKIADYRQDVHSAEYRCVASNQVATIHSKSALVRAGEYPPSSRLYPPMILPFYI